MLKQKFDEYDRLVKEREEARAKAEEANRKLDKFLENLAAEHGKGPFEVNGKVVGIFINSGKTAFVREVKLAKGVVPTKVE